MNPHYGAGGVMAGQSVTMCASPRLASSGCCPGAVTLALGVPGATQDWARSTQPGDGVEAAAALASEERMTAVIGRGGAGHL